MGMSGAGFILLINLAIAGLFCVSFLLIAAYDRRYKSALWFAGAYAFGMLYAALEFLLPIFANINVGVFLGHQSFFVACLLLNIGLARRYEVASPRIVLLAASVASVVAGLLLQDLSRGTFARNFLYQGPYFLMQVVGLYIVLRASAARPTGWRGIDRMLVVFLAFNALHFLSKPFLAALLGGNGSSAREYLSTTYAMASQALGSIVVVLMALILLAALILDLLDDITARSKTDPLSGLFNRRGFEDRLADIVVRLPAERMPVSLVLCDLDGFKRVNDTWGHAAGDRVIAAFAATLKEGAAGHHVAGRIGGEEFAVLLPGCNLAAARLFAEGVRLAFASRSVDGLPAGESFTASFGVAELAPAETAPGLVMRADGALYAAKRAGRDCVRLDFGPENGGTGQPERAAPSA